MHGYGVRYDSILYRKPSCGPPSCFWRPPGEERPARGRVDELPTARRASRPAMWAATIENAGPPAQGRPPGPLGKYARGRSTHNPFRAPGLARRWPSGSPRHFSRFLRRNWQNCRADLEDGWRHHQRPPGGGLPGGCCSLERRHIHRWSAPGRNTATARVGKAASDIEGETLSLELLWFPS